MDGVLMDWRRTWVTALLVLAFGMSVAVIAADDKGTASAQPVDAVTKKLMAANGLFQRSLFKLAGDQYEQFLKENPDHPDAIAAHYALAICYYRLNEYQQAIPELRNVLANPKFEQKDEALAVLGYCELSDKQYDAALKDFQNLIEQFPKSRHVEQAEVYRAQTLFLAGRQKEAADACTAFLQQYPKSDQAATALYFLALSQKATGRNDEALITLSRLKKEFADSRYQLDALLLSGQAFEALGKFDDASEQYRQMLAVAPETRKPDALYSLGVAEYRAGKYDSAAKSLASVIKDYPGSVYLKPAKLQLGLAELSLGKTAEARSEFTDVIKEDPPHAADAQYGLAQCEIADKKFDSAVSILDALVKLKPAPVNLPRMLLDRGVCLMALGKYDEASQAFSSLIDEQPRGPQLPEALYRQAYCLHKLGKYDASHAVCDAFSRQPAPELQTAVAELDAENLFLLTRYPDAEKDFDALATAASDAGRKLRFELRAGQCEYFAGHFEKAAERLGPVASDPLTTESDDLQQAIFLLGDAQLQQGKNAEAAAALKQYVKIAKGDKREAEFKLALAEMRAGDATAEATLNKLSEEGTDSQWVQRGLFELGQMQYKSGHADAARASLTKLLGAKPSAEIGAPATYLLGWLDFDAKNYVGAASTWGRFVAENPTHALAVDATFQQGVALKEAGKPDEALAALTRFAADHPDSANAVKAKQLSASILSAQGKGAEAQQMLSELAKDSKASDFVLYDLAWAQRGEKHEDDAIATYRRLLKEQPDSKLSPAVRAELADLLYGHKRYDEAAALLEPVAADAGVDAKIRSAAEYRLAWCYQKLAKADKAGAAFSDFASRHPDDPLAASALLEAGLSEADAGMLDKAEKHLSEMLQKYPRHTDAPLALIKLGEVQAGQNDFAAALRTAQQFLEKYPKDPLAYRAAFGAGWALENLKKYDEARAAYQKVIASTNGETAARAQFQVGETLLSEQKFEPAIAALLAVEDVYAYPKWSARALLEAGRAFEQLKQPDQARQQYTQLITKYKDAPEAGLAQDRLNTIKGS